MRFQGKVVLITGAASGIGRATAVRLAGEGARLFLVDLAKQGLDETVKHCSAAGAEAESASCDVAQEDQVNDAVAGCVDRFGQLDVLVNVAGILLLSHTHDTTAAQWQKILDVNLTGTFLFCKAALPHLLASGGNIVNTSSTSALAGMPYGAAYGASKGGVLALTRALAVEYGAKRGSRQRHLPGLHQDADGQRRQPAEGHQLRAPEARDAPRQAARAGGGRQRRRPARLRRRRPHQRRVDSNGRGNPCLACDAR